MKVLLTGASGFIGRHILEILMQILSKEAIVVLTSKQIPNVNCVIYSSHSTFSVNAEIFDDVTHIIHAGSFTPKDNESANDIGLCFGNIEYLKELLSIKFKGLKRFINLSTLDVYALSSELLSESSVVRPVSLYGSSKLYCEEMLKAYTDKRGISCINLRIGHVYGPGEEKYKKVVPVSIQRILKNEFLELYGDGSELRSLIFINDVVESIVNALKVDISSKCVNINVVSGVATSIKEILTNLIKISGKSLEIKQKESMHNKRDLVFNNELLLNTLLEKETNLIVGLKAEYEYMKSKYENSI